MRHREGVTSLTSLAAARVSLAGLIAAASVAEGAELVRRGVAVSGRAGGIRGVHELGCARAGESGSVELQTIARPGVLDQSCGCLGARTREVLGVLQAVRAAPTALAELEELAAGVGRAGGGVGGGFTREPASYGCELAVNRLRALGANASHVEGVEPGAVRAVSAALVAHTAELIALACELGERRGWADTTRARRGRCVLRLDARQSSWRARSQAEVLALARALGAAEVLGVADGVCYVVLGDPTEAAYRATARSERGWLLPREDLGQARTLVSICEELRRGCRGRERGLAHLLVSARACLAG